MFFPLTTGRKPLVRAPFTKGVVISNIFIFVLCLFANQFAPFSEASPLLMDFLRDNPGQTPSQATLYAVFIDTFAYGHDNPTLDAMLLSLFLHANPLHIGINMYIVALFGTRLEQRLGSFLYAFLYVLLGFIAFFFYRQFLPDTIRSAVIGASGSAFAIVGMCLILFPQERVKTFVFLPPLVWQVVKLPSRIIFMYFFLVSNLIPFLMAKNLKAGFSAHISGFLLGLFVALVILAIERYFYSSVVPEIKS